MRTARRYKCKKKPAGYNTLIGGIGASITTATALALRLQISENTIENFTVINNDILCIITENYNIPQWCFNGNTELTSYWDYDGKVFTLGQNSFIGTTRCAYFYFPNCTYLEGNATTGALTGGGAQKKIFYFPKLERIGSSARNNYSFWYGTYKNCIAYFSSYLLTSNNGGVEGDITRNLRYRPYSFKRVIYVTYLTKPDAVNDVSVYGIYKGMVGIKWSKPTNAIVGYNIYLDGIFYDISTTNNFTFQNLTLGQTYSIQVQSVDEFYNFAALGKKTTVLVSDNYVLQDVASWHRFQNDLTDEKGIANATNSNGLTYQDGINGKMAKLSGISSYVELPALNDYSFVDASGDTPFTIDFLMQAISDGGSSGIWFLNKRENVVNYNEWQIIYFQGGFRVYLIEYDSSVNGFIYCQHDIALPLNKLTHLGFTYNGSRSENGLEIYLNGIKTIATHRENVNGYTGMTRTTSKVTIGARGWDVNTSELNGNVDELMIRKGVEFTEEEMLQLATDKLNGNLIKTN